MQRRNASPQDFAAYLQSMVQLNALETMTQNLDVELADSQRIMQEIKVIFDSMPITTQNINGENVNNGVIHEDVSKFLEADVPNLLMPDMIENNAECDVDNVIAQMKHYVEEMKESIAKSEKQPLDFSQTMVNFDLDQYAASLDKLNKRLANIKLNKKADGNNRNAELETKLGQLCHDVHMFTQMVQAKTTLCENNKNWTKTEDSNRALQYDNVVNKLLSGINEVTYLLQNKNLMSCLRSVPSL